MEYSFDMTVSAILRWTDVVLHNFDTTVSATVKWTFGT